MPFWLCQDESVELFYCTCRDEVTGHCCKITEVSIWAYIHALLGPMWPALAQQLHLHTEGSPPQVCGLCVQYKTALNPERWEIIVFCVLSKHMDKCTLCLGGRVSVAATPNYWGLVPCPKAPQQCSITSPAASPVSFLWAYTGTPNPVCLKFKHILSLKIFYNYRERPKTFNHRKHWA